METMLMIIGLFGLGTANVILNTKSGPVRGTTTVREDVNTFLGIPFAEPPLAQLRFAKPVPKKPWRNVYNATNFPPPCPQISLEGGPYYFMPDLTNMSEDCLYLNLFVPKSKYTQGLRPVVIFIHGGAFNSGASYMYEGSKLASGGDLIVATINYRLGSFGFFLGHIEEAPGNMGMHDQIMAIKWIKDNAKIFGGDPDNIILMGESAGALSISIHMVSPLSQNLFKKAILESGSMIQPIFIDENIRLDKGSQLMSFITGCANETVNLKTNPLSVVECLKRKPKETIIAAEKTLLYANPLSFYPAKGDEILPKSTVDQYREGKFRKDIDVLLGINRDEGTAALPVIAPQYFGHYGHDSVQTISKAMAVRLSRSGLVVAGVPNASEIVDFYVKHVKNRTSYGYRKMLGDIIGDFAIACGTLFLADFLSLKGNDVFFYKFEFRSASTPWADWVGATHGDELLYVFGLPVFDIFVNFTAEEIEFSNRLIDHWAAFARTGDPKIPGQVPWLRYSYHDKLYMNFGQEEETIRMDPNSRCEIWRKRFRSDPDPPLIRFLMNSGMNETNEPLYSGA